MTSFSPKISKSLPFRQPFKLKIADKIALFVFDNLNT